jgi:hypothetical protein
VGVACNEDEGPDEETFSVSMTGAAERLTPVTTNATGTATFTVAEDESSVDFTINVQNIVDVFAAHIHGPALADGSNNAGVAVTLFAVPQAQNVDIPNGTLSSGTFPSAQFALSAGVVLDSVLAWMRTGRAYVNVHNIANPGGHIRGQFAN